MIYVFITLAAVGTILFIISFFMNNRMKNLEDQVEQLSMNMMKQNYQTKQKLKILEEELLAEDLTGEIMKNHQTTEKKQTRLPLVDTVYYMDDRGYKPHYIAKQTELSVHDVQSILQQRRTEGVHS